MKTATIDVGGLPFAAPRPVPIMIAIGVASPAASGHAMTKTVIVSVSAVLPRQKAEKRA